MDTVTNKNDSLAKNQLNIQDNEFITKKIKFKRETLKNLVTITSREYFDSKQKPDELLALMLNRVINDYYREYLKELK